MELSRNRRIIFLGVLPPTVHGQAIVTAQILEILKENKFDIKVVRIHDLGRNTSLLFKVIYLIKTIILFVSYLRPSKQIVYLPAANSLFGNFRNIPFVLFSRLLGHDVVVHFHTGDFNNFFLKQRVWIRKLLKWIFSLVNTIIILGDSIKDNFSTIIHPKTRVIPINNGINLSDFSKKEIKNINPNSAIRILFMSNLIKTKGYFDVLKAVKILRDSHEISNIKAEFCGEFLDNDGHTDKIEFLDFVRENKLEDIVSLHGLVIGESKKAMINQADFFILPTYYETEAMPISILEAMNAGVVVISTNYRAIPEMILDNQTGCFVDKNRPDQIADKIIELVNNNEKYNSIRFRGFEHLERYFSEELFSKRIISLFNSIK